MLQDIASATHESPAPAPTPMSAPPTPPEEPEEPVHKPGGGHGWLGGHLGLEGSELLVKLKSEAHQQAADAVDAALQPANRLGGHVADMSTNLMLTSAALGLASTGLGVVLLRNGVADLKEGLQHRSLLHSVEATSSLLVGSRSLAAGISLGSHLFPHSEWAAWTGHMAHGAMAPLGIVHGTIDAGLGVKDVFQGWKAADRTQMTQGVLGVGVGASLIAAASGGGLPALVSAGAFLTAKVVHQVATHQ